MSIQHHRRARRRCAVAIAALCALGVPLVSDAAVQATIDRSVAAPGESITLSITGDATSGGAQPDLTPLQRDFQVLGSSSGSETTIVDGHRSDRLRWDIRLQPKHPGRIEVPSIAVGSDRTAAIELNVAQASPAQQAADARHAFVEADVSAASRSPYVQQQVPYTVRLFYDDTVTPSQLDAPSSANAVVEQLGPDRRYTATRDGRPYHVIERDYAIAPEKSGELVIMAPTFRGTQAVQGARSGDAASQDETLSRMLADAPFANMPDMPDLQAAFGPGSSFGSDTRAISSQGRPVVLAVKPRPAGIQGGWLPAEQVGLQDSWAGGAPTLKVGEPVTRVITIEAKGLAASQIPSVAIASPANARAYPDSPINESRTDGQSIYGSSKQSVTYIPTREGAVDIPALDLAWWDVQHNAERHATLPGFHLQAAAGASGASSAVPAVAASSTGGSPASAVLVPRADGGRSREWVVVSASLALLAVLLAYALRRRRTHSPKAGPDDTKVVAAPRRATLMRALRDACTSDASHVAARVLLELARLEWPADPPRGLGDLANRVTGGRAELMELDRSLYGTGVSRWTGAALWHAVEGGLRPAPAARRTRTEDLDPLYPQGAA
ncbi:MAG: BatD family protein [Burkholderiaceae bacterium]